MFLHLSVILFTGEGVCLEVGRGGLPRGSLHLVGICLQGVCREVGGWFVCIQGVWRGGGLRIQGLCLGRGSAPWGGCPPPETGKEGGTHCTGMFSCFLLCPFQSRAVCMSH